MALLPIALNYVKSAMNFDSNGEAIQAMVNYKIAVDCIQSSVDSVPEEQGQELKEQLNFYMQRVTELEKEITLISLRRQKIEEVKEAEIVDLAKTSGIVQEENSSAIVGFEPCIPTTKFADVCGLEGPKSVLEQAVVMPIQHPDLFKDVNPYKGFLFFGPPGTGKTFLAQAAAGEASSSTRFYNISASDLVSKYQGESEQKIKKLFSDADKHSPSIIFIDEIDSLAMARGDSDNDGSRRIKTELFVQMEKATSKPGVFVMAATNTPHNLDDAILRRFDKLIYIPLPDNRSREQLFTDLLTSSEGSKSDHDFKQLAVMTDGFSGSDIAMVCRKIKMQPIQRLQACKFFCPVEVSGTTMYSPCAAEHKEAISISLSGIPKGKLVYDLTTTFEDAIACVRNAKPRVNRSELRKLEKFAEEKGENFTPAVDGKVKKPKLSQLFDVIWNFF